MTDELTGITRLLHLSDSAAPVGAYAHSFGMEGMCQLGIINDTKSLERFLKRDVAASLLNVELPLTKLAHSAATGEDWQHVHTLDALSIATRPTQQLREATTRIGKHQWQLYQKTGGDKVDIHFEHHQSPVVLGTIYALENVPLQHGLISLTYQTYSCLVQAALKLLPLGPSTAQQLLMDSVRTLTSQFDSFLYTTTEDNIGFFNPLWDIGASKHETASARLFIS